MEEARAVPGKPALHVGPVWRTPSDADEVPAPRLASQASTRLRAQSRAYASSVASTLSANGAGGWRRLELGG